MHFEFLVEEESAEAFLDGLLPKVLRVEDTFAIHVFQGKRDLLSKLPVRLKAYRNWLPEDWRIVVLVDEDRQECQKLKAELERASAEANFVTRSAVQGRTPFTVLNRIAIEELEAWYFGDVEALVAAFPGVPPTLGRKANYRDPDAIGGGTAEVLERVLRRAGYYPAGLPKVEVARKMAEVIDPPRNRSKSFQNFIKGLQEFRRELIDPPGNSDLATAQ